MSYVIDITALRLVRQLTQCFGSLAANSKILKVLLHHQISLEVSGLSCQNPLQSEGLGGQICVSEGKIKAIGKKNGKSIASATCPEGTRAQS